MNKNYFFNLFPKEDQFLIACIWEDICMCLDIDYPVYGNTFLPPQIWMKILEVSKSINLNVFCYGLTNDSEKKLIVFAPPEFKLEDLNPEITFFKIDCSNKFKILQHKDFLGSIMSLGLKRESLGDILVKNNIAYCISSNDIFNIIKANLKQINTIPLKIEIIKNDSIPKLEFKEFTDTIVSFRLDSIIASLSNLSRNISVNLIESGDVLVNYNIEKNKSKVIELGSIITIRKKGKFIIDKCLGENKKGKFKILIKQYI